MTMIVINNVKPAPQAAVAVPTFPGQTGGSKMAPVPLPPLDASRLGRLETYADQFADIFTRADQSRWFRLYLRGLLDGINRKNVEAIATRVKADDSGTTNFAQALQHFVSNSPWDASRVLARYRELLPATIRESPGLWVVHDGVIPKKGRHSVGTQRQFARPFGRKMNCQIAVVVGRAGSFGYTPLATRLYLPGYWLREHSATVEKTVPDGFRLPVGKPEIAKGLLEELVREGWAATGVVADEGYLDGQTLRGGLGAFTGPGLRPKDTPENTPLQQAIDRFEWLKRTLGLDHFEGRTWVGWHHHASLVLAAYGFVQSDSI